MWWISDGIENLWALLWVINRHESLKFEIRNLPLGSCCQMSTLIFKKKQNLTLSDCRTTTTINEKTKWIWNLWFYLRVFVNKMKWFHELFWMLSSVISSPLVHFLAQFQLFNQKLPTRLNSICTIPDSDDGDDWILSGVWKLYTNVEQ